MANIPTIQAGQAFLDPFARSLAGLAVPSFKFLFVLCAASLLARLFWLTIAPQDAVASLTPRPLPALLNQSGPALKADHTVLFTTNPFALRSAAGLQAEVPAAQDTDLNLQLLGIFLAISDPSRSSAIIRMPDGETARFIEGSDLLAGITLERIYATHVILKRNGQSEMLSRNQADTGLSVLSDGSAAAPRAVDDGASDSGAVNAKRAVSSADLRAGLAFMPLTESTGLGGLKLDPRSSPEILAATGLSAGDIITSINGSPLSGLEPASAIAQFAQPGNLTLGVQRGGLAVPVTLTIE